MLSIVCVYVSNKQCYRPYIFIRLGTQNSLGLFDIDLCIDKPKCSCMGALKLLKYNQRSLCSLTRAFSGQWILMPTIVCMRVLCITNNVHIISVDLLEHGMYGKTHVLE